ncbi:MAG: hypothetical protein VW602_01730 [Paracoccaceae bacterium]
MKKPATLYPLDENPIFHSVFSDRFRELLQNQYDMVNVGYG